MEIQGLSDAQNIHLQHGALHRTTPSPFGSATGPISRLISTENDAVGVLESPEPQSDSNNNTRPRTSLFHLLAENGSEVVCSPVSKPQPGIGPSVGLYNAKTGEENELASQEFVKTTRKYGSDYGDAVMQMALPLFEGEEEPMPQPHFTLAPPVLRQQREDGAPQQEPSLAGQCATTLGGFNTTTRPEKPTDDLSLVLNGVQDDGSGGASERLPEHGDQMKASRGSFMEVGNANGDGKLRESNDNFNCVDTQRKVENVFNALNEHSTAANAKPAVYHHTVEDVVLTNKYGDKIRGQLCTENNDSNVKVSKEFPSNARLGESSVLITGTSGSVEAMDTSDFILHSTGPRDSANPLTASTSPPAGESFTGTITINNQSIIVTIENGVLTLAAPPEGHVHRDDDMVSLKEHLGMKDHEDIVLLNYDCGTKSIGKISTLAVTSSSLQGQEEPRPAVSAGDSEPALVDDCSLSELGTSLDPCPKQGAGVPCAVTEADLVAPQPKATVADGDNGDFQSLPLIRSKKEPAASFGCPEPGCSCVFDTRQKLKVHLLNHAEDPRPYQCTVEGCGWAFATSYKLKRHLQSHDKQRPHGCQFEGCGRRFTTVYNLKAHVKVHEQDNAFVCEICSERFRSATRLTNHQRVHFEPQRPHKCEYPGTVCRHRYRKFNAQNLIV